MKQRNYNKFKYYNVLIGTIFAIVYGIINLLVVIRILDQEYSVLTLIDSLIISFVLIASSSFMIRDLSCEIEVTNEGIKQYLFKRLRREVCFKNLKEIGEGYIYTVEGKKKRLYFSNVELSDNEKNNLALADKKCIYFSYLKPEIAQEINKYIKYDLSNWTSIK